jgi:hypothetical protein
LHSEPEKTIRGLRDKVIGDNDVSGEVLTQLVEYGLKTITQLINNIHETAEWPKDFLELKILH